MEGIRRAVKVVGPDIGAIRIDSGELLRDSVAARELLDSLGATDCRIVVSSDLDEFRVAELEAAGAPEAAMAVLDTPYWSLHLRVIHLVGHFLRFTPAAA